MEIVLEGWVNDTHYGKEPVKANIVINVNDSGEMRIIELKPIEAIKCLQQKKDIEK